MGTFFLGGCGAVQRELSLWGGLVTVGEDWIWWLMDETTAAAHKINNPITK